MAMVSKGQSGAEFHQAVMAFYGLARRIGRNEKLPPEQIVSELNKFARFIGREDMIGAFAGSVAIVQDLEPAATAAIPAVRTKPVEWVKHAKGKGVRRERSWAAMWEGMRLLIVRKKTGDQGVIFDGSIDGDDVTRGKLLTQVQTTVASEAYRRFRSR